MSVVFLLDAFQTIFSDPYSLMFILIGVTAGVVVGCLPGLTATMGCALLVPFTFSLDPVQGLLMLMGIFTGGIYGGSISGILIRTPGTPAAAATLIDGYLVFGPFNIEGLYSIFTGDMDGNGIGWGLLRPSGAEVVADGVMSEPSELLNAMFTINYSLSLEENTAPLEVYNITYFNLLGKEVKTLDNGLYIKVMQTNKGQVAEKVYHSK